MIDSTLVSLVSAATALVASIAGPLVTLYVARTQFNATVRSANRQRWIEEFRETVAHFCSEIAIAAQLRDKIVKNGHIVTNSEPEFLHALGRLIYSANKIRLLINPLEPEHLQLVKAIEHLFDRFRNAPADHDLQTEGQEIVGQIVTLSLAITRREWLRVKRGA